MTAISVPDEVRAQWEAAATADPPDALALSNLGILTAGEGDLTRGRAMLERAVEVDASNPRAWSNLAAVRATQHDFAGARDAYGAAAERSPRDPAPLHHVGRLARGQLRQGYRAVLRYPR